MIKRFICALLLLAFCFTACIASYVMILNYSNELTDLLSSFNENVINNNNDAALLQIRQCSKKWEKYEVAYSVFLNHDLFQNLSINLPTVEDFFLDGNYEEACKRATECASILEEICEQQKLSAGNIF